MSSSGLEGLAGNHSYLTSGTFGWLEATEHGKIRRLEVGLDGRIRRKGAVMSSSGIEGLAGNHSYLTSGTFGWLEAPNKYF